MNSTPNLETPYRTHTRTDPKLLTVLIQLIIVVLENFPPWIDKIQFLRNCFISNFTHHGDHHFLPTYRIRKALENRTNMEDDRVAILEAQLSQAKLIAEEADKKYEEVQLILPTLL